MGKNKLVSSLMTLVLAGCVSDADRVMYGPPIYRIDKHFHTFIDDLKVEHQVEIEYRVGQPGVYSIHAGELKHVGGSRDK